MTDEDRVEDIAETTGEAFYDIAEGFLFPERESGSGRVEELMELRMRVQEAIHGLMDEFLKKRAPCPHCGRKG